MSFYSENKRHLSIAGLLLCSALTMGLFQRYAISPLESQDPGALALAPKYLHQETEMASQTNQNSSGVYEIVPLLSSPNIGIHSGVVVNNQAFVDRLINLDPSAPDVKQSQWYLTQWKKKTPLMLNNERQDPILIHSSHKDPFLGSPVIEINSPKDSQFGVETSLLIYKNPENHAKVFEIVGRNGYLNQFGGSNVFLTGNITNESQAHFANALSLTFDGKVSRLSRKLNSISLKPIAIGFALSGFTAYNSESKDSLFVQISHADTRKSTSEYRGCYMHGQNLEIVFSDNLDKDFVGKADAPNSPLKAKNYNLNKYLCAALNGKFNCPIGISADHFRKLRMDLSKWRLTGFYTGVETQVAKAPESTPDTPGSSYGEVEVGMQYSNMKISADTKRQYQSCDDVDAGRKNAEAPATCNEGTFKNSAGKTIRYFCGCGTISGGVLQSDGCYHKAL